MTYPTDDLTKVHLDAAADNPTQARAELEALVDKVKAMLAATGTGANNVLKLDASGYIPSGVGINNNVINEKKGADIASATTTDIGAATGNFVDITGTTTITGFGTVQAGARRIVQFDGALTLTYNASSMILPGNANITTAAGDIAEFVSLGSGNWICVSYQRDVVKPIQQGSFTPTMEFASGSGWTYSAQTGRYTKIGNRVWISCRVELSSLGTASGAVSVGNMPFTMSSVSAGDCVLTCMATSVSITAGESFIGLIYAGLTRVTINIWNHTSGSQAFQASEMLASTGFILTGSYITDS